MPRAPKPPPAPLEPAPTRDPEAWERQPNEPPKAYASFCVYRDLPVNERGLRRLPRKQTSNLRQLQAWSSRWSWVARVDAWDAALDERNRQARLAAIDSMHERHIAAASLVMSAIVRRANQLASSPGEIPPRALAALMTAAAKLEREALGVSTRISIDGGDDVDGDPVPLLEWLAGRITGQPNPEGS